MKAFLCASIEEVCQKSYCWPTLKPSNFANILNNEGSLLITDYLISPSTPYSRQQLELITPHREELAVLNPQKQLELRSITGKNQKISLIILHSSFHVIVREIQRMINWKIDRPRTNVWDSVWSSNIRDVKHRIMILM